MDTEQLALLLVHSLIAYTSTKIKDGTEFDHQQSLAFGHQGNIGCKPVYVLIVNSLSLVMFSQYLRDFYYLVAALISIAIIFIITGGASFLWNCGSEGFVNYVTGPGGTSNFTRSLTRPSKIIPKNTLNLGVSQMTGDSQILRPQDPHYRSIQFGDHAKYDDENGELMCPLSAEDQIKLDRIVDTYNQFRPIAKHIQQNLYDFDIAATIKMLQAMLIAEMETETKINFAKLNVSNKKPNANEQALWREKLELNAPLYVFLNFVVKPIIPHKVYLASIPVLKKVDWDPEIPLTSQLLKIIKEQKIVVSVPNIIGKTESFFPDDSVDSLNTLAVETLTQKKKDQLLKLVQAAK